MEDPAAPPHYRGGKDQQHPVRTDAKGSGQVQLEKTRAQWRVQDDRNGQDERDKEAVAHIGFHRPRHGWVAHIMFHRPHPCHNMCRRCLCPPMRHTLHRLSGGRRWGLRHESGMTTIYVLHRWHVRSLWHRCMQCAELSRKGWIARLAPWCSTEKSTICDEFLKPCIA